MKSLMSQNANYYTVFLNKNVLVCIWHEHHILTNKQGDRTVIVNSFNTFIILSRMVGNTYIVFISNNSEMV